MEPFTKILSSSDRRPGEFCGFHKPDLRRLAMAPPRLLKLRIRHAYNPDTHLRLLPVYFSPEHSCPPRVVVRGYDHDRLPAMLADALAGCLGLLRSRVDVPTGLAEVHARSDVAAVVLQQISAGHRRNRLQNYGSDIA